MKKWKVVFRPESEFQAVVVHAVVVADNFGDAMWKLNKEFIVKEVYSITELTTDTPTP